MKSGKFNAKDVRNGLAILIHHNIVEFYTDQQLQQVIKTPEEFKEYEMMRKEKNVDGDTYWYQILTESILMRYRVALFAHFAKTEFDVYVSDIFL